MINNPSPAILNTGLQSQQMANNEQGVPVPYVVGTRRLAVTWISPIYNIYTEPVSGGKKGGKSGKGSANTPNNYNYYGTVAGVVCVGDISDLIGVLINGEDAWPAPSTTYDNQTYYGWQAGLHFSAGSLTIYNAQCWVAQSNMGTNTAASTANAPGQVDGSNNPYWVEYTLSPSGTHDDLTISPPNAGLNGKKSAGGVPTTWGTMRIYWGNQTTTDSILTPSGNNHGDWHPPYTGLGLVILINFFLGQGTDTAPNLELIARRAPKQTVITGSPAGITDGQANLYATAVELIGDENMLGQPALIDSTSFNAAATLVDANSAAYGASALVDSQDSISSIISKITDMVDGWWYWNPTTQLITAGIYKHGVAPGVYDAIGNPTGAVQLTQTDLTERPQLTMDGWTVAKSRAVVKFNDRVLTFAQNSDKWDDQRTFAILGAVRAINLDRPWITRDQQAVTQAAEALRLVGRPSFKGKISVRREIGRSITPGRYVLLDVDLEPNQSTVFQYFRVRERKIPQTGPIELTIEADLTLNPVPFASAGDPYLKTNFYPAPLAKWRIIEAPLPLAGGPNEFIFLGARSTNLQAGFYTYFDTTGDAVTTGIQAYSNGNLDVASSVGFFVGQVVTISGETVYPEFNGSYTVTAVPDGTHVTVNGPAGSNEEANGTLASSPGAFSAFLGGVTGFASYGSLIDSIGTSDNQLTINVPSQVDTDGWSSEVSALNSYDGQLLLVLVSTETGADESSQITPDGSGNQTVEICSVNGLTISTPSTGIQAYASGAVKVTSSAGFFVGQAVTISGATDNPAIDGSYTVTAVPDSTHVTVGGPSGSYDTSNGTLAAVSPVNQVSVIRACYGTKAYSFAVANTEAWLLPRAAVVALTHGAITAARLAGTEPVYFRLTPWDPNAIQNLTDSENVSFYFADPTVLPTIVGSAQPYSGGTVTDFTEPVWGGASPNFSLTAQPTAIAGTRSVYFNVTFTATSPTQILGIQVTSSVSGAHMSGLAPGNSATVTFEESSTAFPAGGSETITYSVSVMLLNGAAVSFGSVTYPYSVTFTTA